MRDPLRHDQTLFRDKDVFDHTYLPEHLHHRDARNSSSSSARPLQGGRPFNGILRGPPGTGKTTTIRRIFAELKDATRMAIPVYVNCRQDHTPNAVYRCIAGEVLGYIPPSWHLARAGFVDLVPGKGRGQEREIRLRYDPGDVLIACRGLNRT